MDYVITVNILVPKYIELFNEKSIPVLPIPPGERLLI